MTYQISRDGQEFGPYSLSDVQRYVGTGNILLTDLARAEGTTDWLPVSAVVGTVPVPPTAPPGYAQPGYAQPGYPQATAAYAMPNFPDPPNLHWALVLLFAFLTCGLFLVVWDFVQVLWMKKVQPGTKAFLYFLIFVGLYILNLFLTFGKMGLLVAGRNGDSRAVGALTGLAALSGLISIAAFAMAIVYRFTMRASLEQHFNGPDPVGLSLSGIMTFFFGPLYFQYHLNRINDIKRTYRLSNPSSPY